MRFIFSSSKLPDFARLAALRSALVHSPYDR